MSKTKTRKQMAREYGVSKRTFYNWLAEANILISNGLLTPKEQQRIYEEFGCPSGNGQLNNTE